MENATKALIIAGAVLIGIILLSIGVALWRNFSKFSAENAQSTRTRQLEEFNVKFKKYEFNPQGASDDEKNYITAQDVRTIANLAKDYNDKNGNGEIIIQVVSNISGFKSQDLTSWKEQKWIEFLNYSNPKAINNEVLPAKEYRATMDNNNGNSDIITKITISDK